MHSLNLQVDVCGENAEKVFFGHFLQKYAKYAWLYDGRCKKLHNTIYTNMQIHENIHMQKCAINMLKYAKQNGLCKTAKVKYAFYKYGKKC